MPAPGSPPVHKNKARSVREFVSGVEVRRALDVETGKPIPVEEPELNWWNSIVLEALIKLIKFWAPRQILKVLVALSAAVGGSMMAEGHVLEATTTFFLSLLIGILEMSASQMARMRLRRKIEVAKSK